MLWQQLGSPTLDLNNTIRGSVSVQKQLRARRFESLDDPVLALTSKVLRRLGPVYIMAFAVYVLLCVLRAAA